MTNDPSSPPSPQRGSISGNYNIIVQASGNGITIDFSQPHLTLHARHRLAPEPKKYLDLLNPNNRAIPMVGRESELHALEAWLDGPGISARCLTGGAGSGKTRLALELCAAADQRKWFAGFIDHKELDRFGGQQNLSAWGWPKPTLIVVDYAAAKARILREWLVELVQHQGKDLMPLRLLLLERHADLTLGWWPELTTPRGWAEEGLRDLFNPSEPIPLGMITGIEHRRQILASAMAAAARLPGAHKPLRPPAAGEDPAFDRRLANPELEFAPLHLMMAGILGVEHGIGTLLTLGPMEMAEDLANFELGRFDKLALDRKLDSEFLRHLAAGITLIGGLSRDDLDQVIAEEGQAIGCGDERRRVERTLLDALPSEQPNQLAPILPDLIGEAAIVNVLEALPPKRQADTIVRWHNRAPSGAMAGIIRTIQDYADKNDHVALKWFDAIIAGT
ncbi:MAG: hypothetical protein ABSG46_00140, partial [Candidatus Binataceae bacterium]